MFSSTTLFCLLTIALSTVNASPVVSRNSKATLRFVTRINERGISNVAESDRARAQAMKQNSLLGKRSDTFSITNGVVHYVADVGVGSPPTTYQLLIDSGSANTFVGANKTYVKTSTSVDTGNVVSVAYGSGQWSGEEWVDTVTLSPWLVIKGQSIGVASSSTGFDNVDGILGVGPVDLTQNTVANTDNVPTVSDNLYKQGAISEEVLGVYFIPSSVSDGKTGKLTFGGYDHEVIASPVSYVPLTKTSPASTFWGIEQSVSYGMETILSSTAGIVDTGTTLILIATDAFNKYQSLTGGVPDEATTLLKITSDQYDKLKPLTFKIGGIPYILSPNGQIWPRSLNTQIGGSSSAIYLVVNDIGTNSGSGLDFMNGYSFLERFYSVYDTTNGRIFLERFYGVCDTPNGRVGFATTAYTESSNSN